MNENVCCTKVAGNTRSILGKYDTLSEAKAEGERIYQGSRAITGDLNRISGVELAERLLFYLDFTGQ